MKKITLIILLLITGFFVFAKQHKHKVKSQPTSRIISASLRHTACYGRCPVYTIEVNKDGYAIYTGIRFTQDSGVFKKNIGKARAMQILNRFSDYKVDTCPDLYKTRVPDLPGLALTVTYTDKIKSIQNSHVGPIELRIIQASLDSLTGHKVDKTWRPVTTTGKKK